MRIDNAVYYVLKDHLGSASVVTDASGNVVGEQRYYPFGETRFTTGSMFTDRLFTGQREMAGLGIYDYGARFYSPKLGRFLSPDTVIPGAANPQAYNRYSYVLNNPLRYTDPTGHWIFESNKPKEEERRNAYLSAWKRTSKDKHSGQLKEYYLVAAAYYQTIVDERPVEDVQLLAGKVKSHAEMVIRNGWNGETAGRSAAGDVSLSSAPDMLGPATIGIAGLFGKQGIPTSTEFDRRLIEWGFSEEEALSVYLSGKKYTDEQGHWIRWNPKSGTAVVVDQFDGTAVTIFVKDQKPRTWEKGWVDRSLGNEPWE